MAKELREAIRLRVHDGRTIDEACAEAGYSVSGWHKAMKRQHVRDLLDAEEKALAQSVTKLRDRGKALAYKAALRIIETSTDPKDVKWAVEFFAREAPAPLVQTNIQTNISTPSGPQGGIEVPRPGVEVVRIETAADAASDARLVNPDADQ